MASLIFVASAVAPGGAAKKLTKLKKIDHIIVIYQEKLELRFPLWTVPWRRRGSKRLSVDSASKHDGRADGFDASEVGRRRHRTASRVDTIRKIRLATGCSQRQF